MNLRQRLLESENHTGQTVDGLSAATRADYEDSLVQGLEDTLYDSSLSPFRSFLNKWARIVHWPESFYQQCRHDDQYCWYVVWYMSCELRRMAPRYEHCYNKLLQLGVPRDEIPAGNEMILY